MSIYSRQKPYELQENKLVKNKRSGKMEHVFEKKTDIRADVNFSTMAQKLDAEKFKDCEYIATTEYKDFDLSKQYKLVGECTYEVVSINTVCRRTQLILRRVVDANG